MFSFFSVPEVWKTGLTCLIGLATLIGIMTRPFRWNESIIAMVGAAVLLLLGLIAPADAFITLIRDWNTFLFFLGMMLIGALSWRRTSLRETASRVSWSIFGFIAGMFIVVRAIEDTGLTTMFGNWLIHLSGNTSFGAVMVGMAGAAVGTNLINNVPMAVVSGRLVPQDCA